MKNLNNMLKSNGFSSSCVQMWELDRKEDWAPKNWCFWTVMMEKTLESPLEGKEIKPVNPKENQLWNQDSVLKSRAITLPSKVHIIKVMVFPVVMYGYESLAIKKSEHWRIDAFELWCWRRLLKCWACRWNLLTVMSTSSDLARLCHHQWGGPVVYA